MQLLRIGEILPLAAAADPKMGAEGRRIRRGLGQELHHPGFGELRFFPGYAHPHRLPGDGVIHEDHEPLDPAQGFPAKGHLIYGKINLRALGQGGEQGLVVNRRHAGRLAASRPR